MVRGSFAAMVRLLFCKTPCLRVLGGRANHYMRTVKITEM